MKTYRPVSFANVDIDMGFWQHRQDLNRSTTVYAVMNRFADTGRFEALKCDWSDGQPKRPHIFWDSDVAKWIESVAYLIKKQPMPDLEASIEAMIDDIEANQRPDGYINSYFTAVEPAQRWHNRDRHELYCAGHFMEAAVAWRDATGRDRLLKMMCRYADYIYRVFVEEDSAHFTTPGHEEIELALVKLYHATGNEKYLKLSAFFIDQRGANEKDRQQDGRPVGIYQQDHLPCAEQTTAVGHSVRACYLYSGMADIARERGDEALKVACQKIFDNMTNRRMYVTAGLGSTHIGEAFTHDYDLPNETAYTETCASISLGYFAQRMLLLEADSKYADAIERALYNGALSGVSLDGKRFFYTNPMEIEVSRRKADGGWPGSREWFPITQRVEVFGCSCCPPNVTRFIASLGDMIFTEDDERVYVHQYMGSTASIGGAKIEMRTNYPVDGAVTVKASGLKGRKLALRIPGWCADFTLSCAYTMDRGYAVIDCDADEFTVDLNMAMPIQLVEANPNVVAAACKACIMRGPVVYCVEAVDNGERLFDCMVDAELSASEVPSEEFLLPVIKAKGWQRRAPESNWLYRPFTGKLVQKELTFIPYYAFANRGETDMRVWIPVKY